MKTLGMIGGVGPESTIDYYKNIIALYRERKRDGHYPQFVINSINLQKGIDFLEANDLTGMADFLLSEIEKLPRAGADFGIIAANTPHIVFDEIAEIADSVDQHRRSNLLLRESAKHEAARSFRNSLHDARGFVSKGFRAREDR